MKHSVGTPRKRRTWYGSMPVGTQIAGAPPHGQSKHTAGKRKPRTKKKVTVAAEPCRVDDITMEDELRVLRWLVVEGRLVTTIDVTGKPFHFVGSVTQHTGQTAKLILRLDPQGLDDDLETPMGETPTMLGKVWLIKPPVDADEAWEPRCVFETWEQAVAALQTGAEDDPHGVGHIDENTEDVVAVDE